jgi:hypothetical protein
MSSIQDILSAEFELLRGELISRYDELGMRASGNWANELAIEVTESGATILEPEYSNQLEYGRSPGKQPPSEAIQQWLIDKGIAARLENEISISSLAFLIARKIGKQGWNRDKYGGTQLVSSVVTPQRIQLIINKIADAELSNFTNNLINSLNAIV